ncbi:MAG: C1 family peptidase [Candidatus Marinimicrobia bacterium]|nr:C1 family peptidase [Candidatus Neomarinimicrobiota bacterium]
MKKQLSNESLNRYKDKALSNPQIRMARNASIKSNFVDIALDWDAFRRIDHTFSDVVTGEMKVTNQKSSGRCWGFAGLNLFRIYLGRKYKLKGFEFSQNYFMFWDKMEKSNYFLESILRSANEPREGRLVMHLLSDPIQDGGQWHMFVNLIKKYGVVPKSEMPETYQSSTSMRMNRMITRKLRGFAIDLRNASKDGANLEKLQSMKDDMMSVVYQMLTISLGTPPDTFDWQVRDKDKAFYRFENLTPQSFFENHVGLNLDDYVCLIDCPMSDKEYHETYTVDYLGNVIEGEMIRYLNLPVQRLKDAAIASINEDNPVWFGCDVGKHFSRNMGVMDLDIYDFELFYNTDFPMSKADRLEYGDSQMTHAMLFTGVDLDNEKKSKKWRVENSWGDKYGDKGYDIMTDPWFDEYTYEVVVHKDYITEEEFEIYQKDPVPLKPWDPMGALAK